MKKRLPIIDIIVIGDEILDGKTIDSNSNFITKELSLLGFPTRSVSIIGDDEAEITDHIKDKVKTSEVIIITGGLGPTPDDITRFAVAKAVAKRLVIFKSQVKVIHKKLKGLSKTAKKISEIEALFPYGSIPLDNTVGVAPGFKIKKNGCMLFCIPGVPNEARDIFRRKIIPFLKKRFKRKGEIHSIIKTISIGETDIVRRIKPYKFADIKIGMYPRGGEVELRLHTASNNSRYLKKIVKRIKRELDGFIYSNSEESIEETIGKICKVKKLTLSCAESCTGGLLAKRITDIPGSSKYFLGGFITYSNKLKADILGVSKHNIKKYGAVSPQVARDMVKGLIRLSGADIGLGITGVAGPAGGSKEKPVGLVYMGLYFKGRVNVLKFQFRGNREKIRWLTSQKAFHQIWEMIR